MIQANLMFNKLTERYNEILYNGLNDQRPNKLDNQSIKKLPNKYPNHDQNDKLT